MTKYTIADRYIVPPETMPDDSQCSFKLLIKISSSKGNGLEAFGGKKTLRYIADLENLLNGC